MKSVRAALVWSVGPDADEEGLPAVGQGAALLTDDADAGVAVGVGAHAEAVGAFSV
jgi:hypothetical protein